MLYGHVHDSHDERPDRAVSADGGKDPDPGS